MNRVAKASITDLTHRLEQEISDAVAGLLADYTDQTGVGVRGVTLALQDVSGLYPNTPRRHTVVGCRVEVVI